MNAINPPGAVALPVSASRRLALMAVLLLATACARSAPAPTGGLLGQRPTAPAARHKFPIPGRVERGAAGNAVAAGASTDPSGYRVPDTTAGDRTAPSPAPAGAVEQPIFRAEGEKVGNDIDLRIERLWLENGFTFAQLDVRNTSPYELEEITIKCTAFSDGYVNLDFREQTLLTRADGRMLPGFSKSLRIRFERGGFELREMSCTAKGW